MSLGQQRHVLAVVVCLAAFGNVGIWLRRPAVDETIVPTHHASFLVPSKPDVFDVHPHNKDKNNMKDCLPTVQSRIRQTRGDSGGSDAVLWKLYSLDASGSNKQVGGDEWYVTYDFYMEKAPQTWVANVIDLHDGSYQLDFVDVSLLSDTFDAESFSSNGTLTIELTYTCGIGSLAPNTKENWKHGGAVRRTYKVEPSIRPVQKVRLFRPPSLTAVTNLSRFDRVVSFGDSVMELFVKSHNKKVGYHRAGLEWHDNIWQPINNATVEPVFDLLNTWHANDLASRNESVALILGSGPWDILYDKRVVADWKQDAAAALVRLITVIRSNYPHVTILWKSPTALHPHRIKPNCYRLKECAKITKYLSQSRSFERHEFQQALMKQLRVPYLDIYEASLVSARATKPGDGLHYRDEWNRMVLNWFYDD